MRGDIPDLAVQKIVHKLANGSVVQLLALAGVSSSWRCVVRQTGVEELRLESSQNLHHLSSFQRDALAAKFHRTALGKKTAFFLAAAKLLRQRQRLICSGEAITDAVVTELAKGSADSVTIEGSSCVTDASLTALIVLCPNVRHLHLNDLCSVKGSFLPTLLRRAQKLESLTLSNLPGLNMDFLTLRCHKGNVLPALQSLTLAQVDLGNSQHALVARFPGLKSLSLACHTPALWAATRFCLHLEEVVLSTDSSRCMDDCLAALLSAPSLRVLELCPKFFTLTCTQLRLAGMLNLRELRLESHAFKQQPLNRVSPSHIDNEGVKTLVDSICTRYLFQKGKQPFKLSLCGATGITHNAVSALLRLPLLSGLLLDGCHRISSIDKMRLVAKVKAGREVLEGNDRRRSARRSKQQEMLISWTA